MTEAILAIIAALGGTAGIISIIKAIKAPSRTNEQELELFKKAFDESGISEQISSLKKNVDEIHKKLEKNDEATACVLRHQITSTYEQFRSKKKIPTHTKEDLCYLYDKYIELGGNSYVKQIYTDMMTWEVE